MVFTKTECCCVNLACSDCCCSFVSNYEFDWHFAHTIFWVCCAPLDILLHLIVQDAEAQAFSTLLTEVHGSDLKTVQSSEYSSWSYYYLQPNKNNNCSVNLRDKYHYSSQKYSNSSI